MSLTYRPPYLEDGDTGIEGMSATTAIYEAREANNVSGSVIPFGRAVKRTGGSDIPTVAPLSGSSDEIYGVCLYSDQDANKAETNDADGFFGIADKAPLSVMIRGTVSVIAENTGAITSPVFVRHTANSTPGANEAIGRFRTNIDTDKAIAVPNARWLTAPVAGKITKLEINLP